MTLTDELLGAIRAWIADWDYDGAHNSINVTIQNTDRTIDLAGALRELLSALDAEHRATLHAERAADQLWQAYDDLQRRKMYSAVWRTRDQIVGLVEEGK